jgi:hypothetical protein
MQIALSTKGPLLPVTAAMYVWSFATWQAGANFCQTDLI